MESIMVTAMYELPSSGEKEFTVTADYARREFEKNNSLVSDK